MKGDAAADFKHALHKHRQRVICAEAIIDNSPPLLETKNYAGFTKLEEDVHTGKKLNRENAQLLVKLNRMVRTRGEIDSFRTKRNCLTPNYNKLPYKCRLLDELEWENMRLGKKLVCTKAELHTWQNERYLRKRDKKKPQTFQYNALIMAKYSYIEIPKTPFGTKFYFRPKIWFNLEVKDVRPLGRIAIELYTAAAPQVVLEFVRFCFSKQKERLNFVRLFPSLWLQGELKLDEQSLVRKNVEYDKRCLDLGQFAGVLSFSAKNLRRCAEFFVPFTISFKPLSVCNGQRVGFGRIFKGLKVLSSIEYFGTKNGKPTKEIIVSNCGVIF